MGIVLLQFLAASIACAGLWCLWRWIPERHRGIVAGGFLLRVLGGIAAFWTSWLSMPWAQSMILGDGIWFYATDGRKYYRFADRLLDLGWECVVFIDQMLPAFQFVQVLAIGRVLFGSSTAAALLLNATAYLLVCRLIARWEPASPDAVRSRQFALAAIALLPTWVLWSTQPLKEAFFVGSAVLFFDGLRRWMIRWREEGTAVWQLQSLLAVVEMLVALFLLGGVRWYYAFFLWFWSLPAIAVDTLRHGPRRAVRLTLAIVLFLLLLQPLILTMWMDYGDSSALLFHLVLWLESSRESFEAVEAATNIVPGPLLASVPDGGIIARASALVLPKSVVVPAGLVRLEGGRGLWAFADADTLAHIVAWIVVIVLMRRQPRAAWASALVLYFAAVVLSMGVMLYVVNNFGTLLRLRSMVMLPLLLIPLAAALEARPKG